MDLQALNAGRKTRAAFDAGRDVRAHHVGGRAGALRPQAGRAKAMELGDGVKNTAKVAEPESVGAPSGSCHHHTENIAVTKEKLFELAVSLVAANISAGQFNDGANFGTIVHEDTQTAYDRLEKLWDQINGDIDDEATLEIEGKISH